MRTLVEFTAKRGDLDLRFTPSSSALEGMAGHAVVLARRGASYQREVSLSADFGSLRVKGRADGFDPEQALLEEVKTYRGDLDAMPANKRALHRAQAMVYGAMLCRTRGLAELRVALVYFNLATCTETILVEQHRACELDSFFEAQCLQFIDWAIAEQLHRADRDAALDALGFPHAAFRVGQRRLSETVYRAATAGRCLLAQAPTGIGKTIATVFPLLKAMPGQRLDKLFFLTAKTPGRLLALRALAGLADPGRPSLRVLELVAKEKSCEYPAKACHGESCPLAQGFYDRLPQARHEALALCTLDQDALRGVALAHHVCPYHLGRELVKWADVVVGDYNYYFDGNAILYGMTKADEWRVGILVDEAHNLVERARQMYSAELRAGHLTTVSALAPARVRAALARLETCWTGLEGQQPAAYRAMPGIPADLIAALQGVTGAIADHLAEVPEGVDALLLRFFFDALHFARLCEAFGSHSVFDLTSDLTSEHAGAARAAGAPGQGRSVLSIRNIVPAPFLRPRFAALHTATLFSATLSPTRFYADLLGLPANAAWVDVESPFTASQLKVHIVDSLSTRFRHRGRSLSPIVSLIARQFERAPGNYLAFFSSFEYLRMAAALFRTRHPGIASWEQSPAMPEAGRAAFLERFTETSEGVGFAVLGGAFGEAIDLPGKRLIGAFVATLGLPRVNPVNEQMMMRMDEIFGDGYDYTYLYPGLRRVVQAAGRVIRTPHDQGTLYLIDDRFATAKVRALLPAWWAVSDAIIDVEPCPA